MRFLGKALKLIVYDFDGVMTNNKALIFPNGDEAVFVDRSDGLAVEKLRDLGIVQVIISSEKNPIVLKRAEKLKIHVMHGVQNKFNSLLKYLSSHKDISLSDVAFVGNDINDLEIMLKVGSKVSPKDAYNEILEIADYVTSAKGGEGVIREIYTRILEENR